MEPSILYKKAYHIDLRDVDFTKKLKLSSLFTYFQDIASAAAVQLGVGINTLEEKYHIAWILMRIRVDIKRMPAWDEDITIETWPQEPKKLEFERDYIVKDQEGNVIIRAVSAWVILDMKERKIKRTNTIDFHFPSKIEDRAITCKLGKLKDFGQLETAYPKVIGYSDVDFNGHLNNSKYVDYIMDCFDIEEHKKYAVTSIEVNFTNEALPGEMITLRKDTSKLDSDVVYIEGVNKDSEKVVFKSRLEIKAKD